MVYHFYGIQNAICAGLCGKPKHRTFAPKLELNFKPTEIWQRFM